MSTLSSRMSFPERPSWQRFFAFCAAFLVSAAIGLTYVYSRPAEYRAVSRLQISPARVVGEGADELSRPTLQDRPEAFLTEVQVLTSRPLLQQTADRLKSAGTMPDLGSDPIGAMQGMLQAEPVEGTQVVQLSAVGPEQAFVWQLVNTVAQVYRDRVVQSYQEHASSTYAEVREEAQRIQRQAEQKRDELNTFRERNDIVSLERDENGAIANIQNLSRSYSTGNEALAKALGRLRALRKAAAGNGVAVSGKDDPTLASMEQRASTLREELRDLQRRYTPQYLALDADAVALQARLSSLEQQLKTQRMASQEALIAAAEEDVATNREAVDRLHRDLNQNQDTARAVAARLADFKVLQDDLDHLQGMARTVNDRLTKLQASELERAPKVELLELATPSSAAWRPNYTQDAIIALTGSLVVGLFAVWFLGFIGGPAPAPVTTIQHTLVAPLGNPALLGRMPAPAPVLAGDPQLIQLPPRQVPPRELSDSEVAQLISHANDELRLATAALLSGMSPEEVVALRWDMIDAASGMIAVKGEAARTIPMEGPLLEILGKLRQSHADEISAVLRDEHGEPLTVEGLGRLVLYGAYDAGLERPQEISPAALRHTYLAYLLRGGIRASDIGRVAGHVPQEVLVNYLQLSPSRTRVTLDQIDRVHPALRGLSEQANS